MESNIDAKTIQIFLPTGEPRGIRIAEITTRIVQAVAIPRSDLAKAKVRPELDQPAVYFLIGESEENAKPAVYIGQSEDPRSRLDQHNSTRDFWQIAIVIISRTHSFTQAHIRYLEWYCIKSVLEIGRYTLVNGNSGSEPHVTEPIQADLMDAYTNLSILTAALGYPLLEQITKAEKEVIKLYIKNDEVYATGEYVEDGFAVMKGSTFRKSVHPGLIRPNVIQRQELIDSGILVEKDNQLILTEDYLFGSPSFAASLVLGRGANGWTEWEDAKGNTLDVLYRNKPVDE